MTLNPLNTQFKMVTTNTGASSIQEAAVKADAVLFCDRHYSEKYQKANSAAFDFLWTPDTKFFVEGLAKDHAPSARSKILESAIRWENSKAIDEMFLKVDEEEEMLLASFYLFTSTLLAINNCSMCLLLQEINGQDSIQTTDHQNGLFETLDLLKKNHFFTDFHFPVKENLTKNQLESLLKGLAENWCQSLHQCRVEMHQLIENSSEERNQSLATTLIKAHREGVKKIVAVAGSDHLRIPKEQALSTAATKSSINLLYHSLEAAGISYVTLKATKQRFQNEASSSRARTELSPTENLQKRRKIDSSREKSIQEPTEQKGATEEYAGSSSQGSNFLSLVLEERVAAEQSLSADTVNPVAISLELKKIKTDIMKAIIEKGLNVFAL